MGISEQKILSFLKSRFNPSDNAALIGDDAAIIRDAGKYFKNVITIDTLAEGTHFYHDTDPFETGTKLASVSLSDNAAMGACPQSLLISLALPEATSFQWVKSLYKGIEKAAAPFDCKVIGGDTVRSSKTVLTSVGIGKTFLKTPVYRKGAKKGAMIYATGSFGYSLKTGHHLKFVPRVKEIEWLLRHIKIFSLTDASDGLARSIELLTTEQGMGADIALEQVKVRSVKNPVLEDYGRALYDGEDFELLFCAGEIPKEIVKAFISKFEVPLSEIGTVGHLKRIKYSYKGKPVLIKGKPFQHFPVI